MDTTTPDQTTRPGLAMGRLAWACSLFMLLGAATVQAAQNETPVANFTTITGTVDTTRQRVDSPISAKVGMDSFQNDTVSTKHHSRTQLTFIDGSKLSMGQDYQMAIKDFQYDQVNKTRKAVLNVVSGIVHVDVAKLGSKTTDFTVETPTAVISVRGTAFYVTVVDGKTYVSVTEGTVQVTNAAGQTISVTAGQTVAVTSSTLTSAFDTPEAVIKHLSTAVKPGAPFPAKSDITKALDDAAKGAQSATGSEHTAKEAAKNAASQAGGYAVSSGGVSIGAAALAILLTSRSGSTAGTAGTTVGTTIGTR